MNLWLARIDNEKERRGRNIFDNDQDAKSYVMSAPNEQDWYDVSPLLFVNNQIIGGCRLQAPVKVGHKKR